MDQGLPDEIMEGDDVVRQWQNKNTAANVNWSEREWTDEYDEESGMTIKEDVEYPKSNRDTSDAPLDPFAVTDADLETKQPQQELPEVADEYPRVGECVYIQWVADETSEEAPGWYFGTVDNITPEGLYEIEYADNATEVLDLTKVNFVPTRPGNKFYVPTRPKHYKPHRRSKPLESPSKQRRTPRREVAEKQRQTIQMMLEEEERREEAEMRDEDEEEELREEVELPADDILTTLPSVRLAEVESPVLQTTQQQEQPLPPELLPQPQPPSQPPPQLQQEEVTQEQVIQEPHLEEEHQVVQMEEVHQQEEDEEEEEVHHQQGEEEVHHHQQGEEEVHHHQQGEEEVHQQGEEEVHHHQQEEEVHHHQQGEEEVHQQGEEEEVHQQGEEEEVHQGEAEEDDMMMNDEGGGPTRYIEAGNILIPALSSRHPQQQIILVQRGPNGELEEVTHEEEEIPEPLATIIEETTEVEAQEGHIEEEHEFEVDEDEDEDADEDEDSSTEIIYPDDVLEHDDDDRSVTLQVNRSKARPYSQESEVVVEGEHGGIQLVRRTTSPLHMSTDQYLPPHTTEQVERYDGRIISSEQMMMGCERRGQSGERIHSEVVRQRGSAEHIPQRVESYQEMRYEDEDLERLQGRLITEDAMNMMDDKGADDDDYSGDDEQDPRMPRRRGKYVRKTPEELDQVPRPWSCEFCPRAFPNKYHLQIHLRTHTGEKPYRCTECDMAFSHSSNLCSHIRTHNGIKPYKCKHCGKEFGRSNNMKAHTRIHTGEKPFECRFCGKAFRFGNHLTIHERSHTGERPYKCTYCDRAFRNSSNLRTHERLHTDERPYRCRYCDRAFSGSGNLHAHERVHTGERPFVCDVCQKAFSQSSTLRIHQRIHTGDKRYQCSLCGRRFIQSNHLKTHLRRMHHIDDSLPSIRTMHKNQDMYGMQPLNPNNFRVVTKQEPDEMEHSFDRDIHLKTPMMIKRPHHESRMEVMRPGRMMEQRRHHESEMMRPSPLVVDDDVRTKSWGSASPLLHGDEENHRIRN